MKEAWFCPACQKHHAPHCDTCPSPTEARPLPGVNVFPIKVTPYQPDPNSAPWTPYWTSGDPIPPPVISTCTYPHVSTANGLLLVN